MKAFAVFLIVLCLVAAAGIIYMLVTSNLTAVCESCERLSLKDTDHPDYNYSVLFDMLKAKLEEGTFTGTRFSDEPLTSADQYCIYIWKVRVENRTALPARVAEIQALPMKSYDILQFDMNALVSDMVPDRIVQPHSVAYIDVCVLASSAISSASSRPDVRDATITWYFAGYPFPESNGKGGRLVLRP